MRPRHGVKQSQRIYSDTGPHFILGLIRLSGIVVAPYPFKDWRVKPNAAGERRR